MSEAETNSKPTRIQLRRTKGCRLPPNTVNVARPSRYGNPHLVGWLCPVCGVNHTRAEAVAEFRAGIQGDPGLRARIRTALAGKNLACWCRLDQSCHADVLLEVANEQGKPQEPQKSDPPGCPIRADL